jgi:hypothetical protein
MWQLTYFSLLSDSTAPTTHLNIILKQIVETIDRFGLKTRYLRKHEQGVARFFRRLSSQIYRTETAARYQKRFEKNRQTLFTFLEHDGVSWNNNTAEHAIKALAALRGAIGGKSKEGGTDENGAKIRRI